MEKLKDAVVIFSAEPGVGQSPIRATDATPYEKSLAAGPISETPLGFEYVDWNQQRTISLVIDLLGDSFIDRVTVEFRFYDVQYWRYQRLLLSARTSEEEGYRVVCRHLQMDDENQQEYMTLTLQVGRRARFLKLDILRPEWICLPIPLVCVYGERPSRMFSPLTQQQMEAEISKEAILVDIYGQCVYLDWPGKIHSDEQLRQNAAREKKRVKDIQWDSCRYDRFGGWKCGKTYEATGFFRVQKIDGVWWFITPEGNPFFLKGVDDITYDETSYCTPLYQPNTRTLRGVFEALPDKETCGAAYKNVGLHGDIPVVDHLEANLIRKYGENYP